MEGGGGFQNLKKKALLCSPLSTVSSFHAILCDDLFHENLSAVVEYFEIRKDVIGNQFQRRQDLYLESRGEKRKIRNRYRSD